MSTLPGLRCISVSGWILLTLSLWALGTVLHAGGTGTLGSLSLYLIVLHTPRFHWPVMKKNTEQKTPHLIYKNLLCEKLNYFKSEPQLGIFGIF